MSERTVLIDMGMLHCADCLATLSQVVPPKMPGVEHTAVTDAGIEVLIDEARLTETQLVSTLTEAGLLR
jgi:hypothetical protein